MWLVDQHVVSCRNYLGGTHLEIYLDSDLVHCVPTLLQRVRREIHLPIEKNPNDSDAHILTLTISTKKEGLLRTCEYELTRGGDTERIPPHNDPCSEWNSRCEQLPGLEHCVSIPTARLATEMRDGPGMEGVVLYKLRIEPLNMHAAQTQGTVNSVKPGIIGTESICASSVNPYAEWKRYNDFDELYTLVRSAYNYYPLDTLNIPKPPGKTLRKRADSDFIESRRASLEGFLKGLLRLTRISYNPDMLRFLGILDGRCNPVGRLQDEPAPLYRLKAPVDTDEDDEICNTGPAGGQISRNSLRKSVSAEKEKFLGTVKDAMKTVKQAISSHGLLPGSIVHSGSKAKQLDDVTSAARAKFLAEAKSLDVADVNIDTTVGDSSETKLSPDGAVVAAVANSTDSEPTAISFRPVLLSAAQDEARRKERDNIAAQRSQQYAGSAYIAVSRIKAEAVAKQRARRKSMQALAQQATQVAELFGNGDVFPPSPRSSDSRAEALKMYPGVGASGTSNSDKSDANDGLFSTPRVRRSKAEIEAAVIRQMDEIDANADSKRVGSADAGIVAPSLSISNDCTVEADAERQVLALDCAQDEKSDSELLTRNDSISRRSSTCAGVDANASLCCNASIDRDVAGDNPKDDSSGAGLKECADTEDTDVDSLSVLATLGDSGVVTVEQGEWL